jgi:hypothetical protein
MYDWGQFHLKKALVQCTNCADDGKNNSYFTFVKQTTIYNVLYATSSFYREHKKMKAKKNKFGSTRLGEVAGKTKLQTFPAADEISSRRVVFVLPKLLLLKKST